MSSRVNKIVRLFFLLLFLGYFGCINFFYHSHIVSGDTIVHSHPYKTNNQGFPSHSHSGKGYITIYMLSIFAVSLLYLFFNFKYIAPLFCFIRSGREEGLPNHKVHYLYLLRAPPAGMLG
jgi:hypothetical protein